MPWESEPHALLIGRAAPLRRLERLIAGLRAGRGGAVAVTGEPGVGKTALLARLTAHAPGATVLATSGVAGEAELPYAALGDLLHPLLGRLPELPAPQARALGAALALRDAPAGGPAPYAICMATLTLLTAEAGRRPLLVVVDAADAIDPPSAAALLFVARRVRQHGVALVFGVRAPLPPALAAAGVPPLMLAGLRPAEAAELVDRLLPGQVAARVRDRLCATAHGNPRALTELCAALADDQLTGAVPLPAALAGPVRGEFRPRAAEPGKAAMLDRLTRRELQVARAVAGGLSNPEAASALRLSRKTVETHLSSAYRKLGVRSRTQLVRYLVEAGVSGSSPMAS
jgi:DNA-binding NarL/FixJ family response regulator